MARNVEELVLVYKNLLTKDVFLHDLRSIPVYWNEELYITKKKLKIGYFLTNNIFKVKNDQIFIILSFIIIFNFFIYRSPMQIKELSKNQLIFYKIQVMRLFYFTFK
jgi:hypothetical protein